MIYLRNYPGKHEDPEKDEKGPERVVRCRAVDEHHRLLRKSAEYRARRREIEHDVRQWLRAYGNNGLRTGLIRIPVVVHVVWNTPDQNISDAQIQSQIDVLNEDFRRLNADAAGTPAPFAAVAADARLEFALATRGPGCVPTTGINRVHTSVTGWTYPGNGMKAAATGGADPWDSSQYLNVWIVNFTDGTLGFGTFPGGPAARDGLVLKHSATGRTGTLIDGADRGRTATHEVGHWLDLFHIWGDDGTACYGDDLVADTPNQAGPSPFSPAACRVFPAVSCSNGPDGDMFMNYMDYSADQCLTTFTAGQAARMDAALHTSRSSILASPGLVPPTGVGPDLWCKDTSDDDGTEPNPSSQPMYISDDIYVRRHNDGLANQDHENPEYRLPGGPPNYVYVRVRNRACGGSESGTVKLYWAKASTGLSWPAPWDGSVTVPALMGQPLGSQPVTVLGGDDEILAFPWSPPDPADYASFGADQHHFCLLARIETSASAPFGMSSPETTSLYANVKNNNNIVWKNISVVDDLPGTGRTTGLLIANYGREPQKLVLRFTLEERRPGLLDWGRVQFGVPYELAERLHEAEAKGIKWISETRFLLTDSEGIITGAELQPKEVFALDATFIPDGKAVLGAGVFPVDIQQFDGDEPIGGVRILLRTHGAHRPNYADGTGDGYLPPLDGDNFIGGPVGRPCVPKCGC